MVLYAVGNIVLNPMKHHVYLIWQFTLSSEQLYNMLSPMNSVIHLMLLMDKLRNTLGKWVQKPERNHVVTNNSQNSEKLKYNL